MGDQHGGLANADALRHADRGVPGRGVQPVESLHLGAPRDKPPAGDVRADHVAGNRSADLAVWREVRLLAAHPRAVSILEWGTPPPPPPREVARDAPLDSAEEARLPAARYETAFV